MKHCSSPPPLHSDSGKAGLPSPFQKLALCTAEVPDLVMAWPRYSATLLVSPLAGKTYYLPGQLDEEKQTNCLVNWMRKNRPTAWSTGWGKTDWLPGQLDEEKQTACLVNKMRKKQTACLVNDQEKQTNCLVNWIRKNRLPTWSTRWRKTDCLPGQWSGKTDQLLGQLDEEKQTVYLVN